MDWMATLDDIRRGIADSKQQSFYPIRHGTMRVGVYAPAGHDPQSPHEQDELYVIISGTGTFRKGGETRPFGPGDVIFVEAGVDHRFEDFSSDFETWVVFWGPEGGETP